MGFCSFFKYLLIKFVFYKIRVCHIIIFMDDNNRKIAADRNQML